MNEYIFYTTEGSTIAPNEDVNVENCQVLGRTIGRNVEEAQKTLLKDNPWILEAGYNAEEFIVKQIVTNELRADIKTCVDYLWTDEKQHYEESDQKDKQIHIFNVLKRLKEAL